jgi:hypothetical protein
MSKTTKFISFRNSQVIISPEGIQIDTMALSHKEFVSIMEEYKKYEHEERVALMQEQQIALKQAITGK